MNNDKKLRAAKRWLAGRGIAATAIDSRLVYTDSAGRKRDQPEFLQRTAASDERDKKVTELPKARKANGG